MTLPESLETDIEMQRVLDLPLNGRPVADLIMPIDLFVKTDTSKLIHRKLKS